MLMEIVPPFSQAILYSKTLTIRCIKYMEDIRKCLSLTKDYNNSSLSTMGKQTHNWGIRITQSLWHLCSHLLKQYNNKYLEVQVLWIQWDRVKTSLWLHNITSFTNNNSLRASKPYSRRNLSHSQGHLILVRRVVIQQWATRTNRLTLEVFLQAPHLSKILRWS